MAILDYTGPRTDLIFAADNDKVLNVGPYLTLAGAIRATTSKRLRIVVKPLETTADASATVDKNSVTHATVIYTVGVAALGTWAIDLSGLLPAAGRYWYRIELAASSSADTDREIMAKGSFTVKAV